MTQGALTDPAGLYIHIPFCMAKCPYCDFFSITDHSLKKPLLKAIEMEMAMVDLPDAIFDTIYFGGGTPSVLDPENIEHLIKNAMTSFCMSSSAEITLEVNPGTADLEKLKGFKAAGVNRLTLGVQSFFDSSLKFLGRIHSAKQSALSIEQSRMAGFDNIGIDLIYGIAGQSQTAWINDLKKAVEYQPEHISCYMLTYEPGTPMEKKKQQHAFEPLEDSVVCDLFNLTIDYLGSHNYTCYEISNFALEKPGNKKDYRSKHNWKYWTLTTYIGIGPSAHSYIKPVRYKNISNVETYIKKINSGQSVIEEKEILSKEQQMIEAVYLGLRKINGLDMTCFEHGFSDNFVKPFKDKITFLEKKGMLTVNKNHCRLTRKGLLFHNSIAAMLI